MMRGVVAGDEVRRTRAHAHGLRCGTGGVTQRGMTGQTEVVITAKRHQRPPVHLYVRALRTFQQPPLTLQALRFQLRQIITQPRQRSKRHRARHPWI